MPVIRSKSIALTIAGTIGDLADSLTYYYGGLYGGGDSATTTANYRRITIPVSGFIRKAILWTWASGVAGTAENIVIAIRKNNTTDYTFATVGSANAVRVFSNYNLNIPVSKGDYIELKISTPAWVTNPTAMSGSGAIVIDYM